ncbi:IMPACT family protein [Maribacter sp. 2307ULW6-5]|uniref:IMPACT family protein n=1 Tax=Maribacter sp. 2307ULW6-5 TaxID=3386275 RepID=UPI0039BCA2A1
MEAKDSYSTIAAPVNGVLLKERKSKFFGHAYPIASEDEVKPLLETLQKTYPTANHFCYAWQLGTEDRSHRANDDGEPNNSAGMPIYGQIQSFDLTNLLLVVVRVFGGTKLGVGGLITAYRETAKETLQRANIVTKTIEVPLVLSFGYAEMNKVMRLVRTKKLRITAQQMGLECQMTLAVRKGKLNEVKKTLEAHRKITIVQGTP